MSDKILSFDGNLNNLDPTAEQVSADQVILSNLAYALQVTDTALRESKNPNETKALMDLHKLLETQINEISTVAKEKDRLIDVNKWLSEFQAGIIIEFAYWVIKHPLNPYKTVQDIQFKTETDVITVPGNVMGVDVISQLFYLCCRKDSKYLPFIYNPYENMLSNLLRMSLGSNVVIMEYIREHNLYNAVEIEKILRERVPSETNLPTAFVKIYSRMFYDPRTDAVMLLNPAHFVEDKKLYFYSIMDTLISNFENVVLKAQIDPFILPYVTMYIWVSDLKNRLADLTGVTILTPVDPLKIVINMVKGYKEQIYNQDLSNVPEQVKPMIEAVHNAVKEFFEEHDIDWIEREIVRAARQLEGVNTSGGGLIIV